MTQSTKSGHALVTGASSGIGAAIAREYARRGKPLVLVARRADRLEALAAELSARVPCVVIAADLADPATPARLFADTQARGIFVDTLVNNAGYGVPGRYLSADWKTHADFLQVLMTSVAELTHRYLPAMEAARHGRILNVASLAGLVPATAGHTLYGATKLWLIRFSESLDQEMRPHGVHVTALCPGMTYTEFHDVNGMREKVSKLPKGIWLGSDDVARLGVDAVESGRARIVTGRANRLIAALSKYLPDALARALISSRSKDFRDAD
ncbi:SDR family NAD(P)-dependent oxidoreductase [Arenimonas sp. MALMAid1274]|uniref:SDR family NAD(P)-dependent oxidoreductase n=1 Tax=Arenimonas sp. MALMAid1274 TaxID=3411630 RepID=UPI003B9FB8FE